MYEMTYDNYNEDDCFEQFFEQFLKRCNLMIECVQESFDLAERTMYAFQELRERGSLEFEDHDNQIIDDYEKHLEELLDEIYRLNEHIQIDKMLIDYVELERELMKCMASCVYGPPELIEKFGKEERQLMDKVEEYRKKISKLIRLYKH